MPTVGLLGTADDLRETELLSPADAARVEQWTLAHPAPLQLSQLLRERGRHRVAIRRSPAPQAQRDRNRADDRAGEPPVVGECLGQDRGETGAIVEELAAQCRFVTPVLVPADGAWFVDEPSAPQDRCAHGLDVGSGQGETARPEGGVEAPGRDEIATAEGHAVTRAEHTAPVRIEQAVARAVRGQVIAAPLDPLAESGVLLEVLLRTGAELEREHETGA